MQMIRHRDTSEDVPDDFPAWVFSYWTKQKMQSRDWKTRMKALRSAASAFIAKETVRKCIFSHKGHRCYICGREADQIDHKIPVSQFSSDEFLDYWDMNNYDNLFPICGECNIHKAGRSTWRDVPNGA